MFVTPNGLPNEPSNASGTRKQAEHAEPRKGVAQYTIWLVFGMILLVLTGALLYVILPHSDCDRQAAVSANEVKSAIECAAKYPGGMDPVTGKSCNVANVKLCQEDSFSIYGVGYVAAYLGLMVPEYMIYYQQFPTQQYKSLIQGGTWGFTESYPFERAYVGQRPYDIRPTLTQFKQYFKTKYLQQPCTDAQGLCFNVRGKEDVVMVDGNIPDVRLQRTGYGFAETNPKFYLVAPCYAKVTFKKGSDGKIYGRPERLSVGDASNYCYADETMLGALMGGYAAEANCEAGMLALMFVSLGGEKAVQESAEVSAEVAIKTGSKGVTRAIVKQVVKDVLASFKSKITGLLGKGAEKAAAKETTKAVLEKVAVKDLEGTFAKEFFETGGKDVSRQILGRAEEELLPETVEKGIAKEIVPNVIARASAEAPESVAAYADYAIGDAASQSVRVTFEKAAIKDMTPGVAKKTIFDNTKAGLMKYDAKLTEAEAEKLANNAAERALANRGEMTIKEAMDESLTEAMQGTTKFQGEAERVGFETANGEAVKLSEDTTTNTIEREATYASDAARNSFVDKFAEDKAAQSMVDRAGLSAKSKALVASRSILNRYATMEGIKPGQMLASFAAIPCVDVDLCRAASACGETLMWPGLPFKELTDNNMKGGKPLDTVSDVFHECCIQYNYGAENDTDKINCTEPSYLVDLVKADLGVNESNALTLTKAGAYLGLDKVKIPIMCSLANSENSKDCRDAQEMRALHLTDNCVADVSTHTYDFGTIKPVGEAVVTARLYRDDCPPETNLILEVSNDSAIWTEVNRTAAITYPTDNFIYLFGKHAFRFIRVSEDGACYFDATGVVLDPIEASTIEAQADTKYTLSAETYNYFVVPANYTGKASTLCKAVEHCTSMAKWLDEEGGWIKWANEGGSATGTDFSMMQGDKVGIYVTEKSTVVFEAEVA
jgi:hypothetical protein